MDIPFPMYMTVMISSEINRVQTMMSMGVEFAWNDYYLTGKQ